MVAFDADMPPASDVDIFQSYDTQPPPHNTDISEAKEDEEEEEEAGDATYHSSEDSIEALEWPDTYYFDFDADAGGEQTTIRQLHLLQVQLLERNDTKSDQLDLPAQLDMPGEWDGLVELPLDESVASNTDIVSLECVQELLGLTRTLSCSIGYLSLCFLLS
ncbi:hypothetical protein EKO04_011587 [Ascochyta lentis]|uniref:Uncharacterized protein n=1 Tax=Ascochyta lentis TaxID=205686 RepID=A0A8H7MD72_9PLEO|nr:hypothetical protein EKO04_011587 [Ascochyta lentis]